MNNLLATNQASVMLSMQSKMNSKIERDWVVVRFPYLRAVVVEAAEAMEHHGWKWWKKQECDLPQLQMEIVDIWHFILSEILIAVEDDQRRATDLLLSVNEIDLDRATVQFDGRNYELCKLDLLSKLELLIGISVARRIELGLFKSVLLDSRLEWDQLFSQYVSKNVLNFFRQDYGYKTGEYMKIWDGREDNEHLVEIMAGLDSCDSDYPDQLYAHLASRYPQ